VKTQAVVFPEANRFEMTEVTPVALGPGDVAIRTLVTAISPGTERWILRGKHIGTRFPCVPGYHRIGIVEECGAEVANFQRGDIVYGAGGRWQEEGIISMWGAHVGYSVGPWGGYHFVASSRPSLLELETLAFTILAGVSNRGMNMAGVRSGDRLLILGAGIVGVCAAQIAAARGAVPVLVDKDPERIAFVRSRLGLRVLAVDDPKLKDGLKEAAPAGFDILQDTVGHAATTDAMVQLVRGQGTLLLQAQYFDKAACALDLDQIKIKELTVKTTCGIREQDWQETMAHIRERRLKIAPLISHRFERKEILKGYELIHTGKPHNLGIVFHWE
jgi:2-desacetyl-2-hydroxyethyl bacteriochlorophyllide A dehydrogenase